MTTLRSGMTGCTGLPLSKSLFFLAPLLCMVLVASLRGQRELRQYAAAIHVHSKFSNGHHDVLELARETRKRNIDVLILADSFLTTVRYGVWPLDRVAFQGLNKMVRPGVRDHGVSRYLEAVQEARERIPDLIIIPGVEVTPHYYWRGSPWEGLELYDFDRHLIVLGLSEVNVLGLPVIGNETLSNTDVDWTQVVPPAVLLVAGVLVFLSRKTRKIRLKHYRLKKRQRRWKPAVVLILCGAVLAVNNYPFGRLSDPYSGRHDVGAYQRLIDYVGEKGGVVYWSYPEARFREVNAAGATMVSAPHPEDLRATHRYNGFEGIYGDRITVTLPGQAWDQILLDYVAGARVDPPFITTGIDFHYFKPGSRWFDLDGGQTMLLLGEKSETEVLAALREGRVYATFQEFDERIRLSDFRVEAADGSKATQGGEVVTSGPITVKVRIDWLDQPSHRTGPFIFEMILDGEVVERLEQNLPIHLELTRELEPGRHYLRLTAHSATAYRILSNPIFVTAK